MTTLPGDASTLHDDFGEPTTPEPGTPAAKAIEGRSLTKIAWTRLKRDKVAMSAGCIVVLMCLLGLFSGLIAPHLGGGPQLPHSALIDGDTTLPTGTAGGLSSQHWLGVDPTFGRDIAARIVEGAKWSLLISFLSTALTVVLGLVAGLLAGYFGGWVDSVIMRLVDIVVAFPFYVLIIALVFVLGPGERSIYIAITLVGWVAYARIIRGEILVAKRQDYITAARSGGLSNVRIMRRHLLPNVISQGFIYGMSDIVQDILAIVTLGYLGLGIPPPTADLGSMINDGQNFLSTHWQLTTIPGLAVVVVGLGLSLVGDGLADLMRPGQ